MADRVHLGSDWIYHLIGLFPIGFQTEAGR